MNTVLNFLRQNWPRLQLQNYGDPSRLSCIIATPRFRASAHLIFFILSGNDPRPIFVAKTPRLPGDTQRLDREVMNLRLVQAARPSGFDSIPRVLAYEDYCEHRLLIETPLVNPTMRPAVVRRQPQMCIAAMMKWLFELNEARRKPADVNDDWYRRLILRPLEYFEAMFPVCAEEKDLLGKTRELAQTLRERSLPLVFEHGDLSSPNILLGNNNEIAVVDWELAESRGLPAVDLFFFLTYVAFARERARDEHDFLNAFQNAFFGPRAWAIPYILQYREFLQLSSNVLKPLFVLCWSRYVAGLVTRLKEREDPSLPLSERDANWLRRNRYYTLWKYAVENMNELSFTKPSQV
jgi:thiamine kinase-like enzyme